MSNGEMFIVAKPRFDTTSSGQSEISIVDVWLVPDNGQGRVPTNIDMLRAGEAPRQYDPQKFYQPSFQNYLNSFQHMTLVRTPQGWQLQPDGDPRLMQYRVPRISQDQVDPRYVQNQYRGNCGCIDHGNTQFVQPRSRYVDPRSQLRVQIGPQYPALDPRGIYRVPINPQQRAVDPRFSQADYQRQYLDPRAVPTDRNQPTGTDMQRQYQNEIRRMSDEELTLRYEELMQRRQTEQQRMMPRKIDPKLPEQQYKKQYQEEVERRRQVELQRRDDALLQRTFEVEMRRRLNEHNQRTQRTQTPAYPDLQDQFQQRRDAELRRRYEIEMQRRLEQQQNPQQPSEPRTRPQVAPAPRPQGRATYGVDPNVGLTLEQRNQDMRRQVDQLESGYQPRAAVPQGRARYGVDQRTAADIIRRDSEVRDQTAQLDDYIFDRPPDKQQYRPQYQPQAPFDPQASVDPNRWRPRQGNLRSWDQNLDFDPDGTKIKQNVGTYLGRYGPPSQQNRNPNGVYGPSLLSPQGIIENSVDSTLRSWGNYIRGK